MGLSTANVGRHWRWRYAPGERNSSDRGLSTLFLTHFLEFLPPMKISFDEHLQKIFGSELDAFLHHPPLGEFVRVNTLRTTTEKVIEVLQRHGFDVERVAGLDDALRLRSMPYEPTTCLHHFAGWYVKQSLSSQLPVRFLDAQPGQNIIDLCAAPGSKTTQIATAMRNQGCLIANDLAGKRMTPLAARLDSMIVSHAVLYNMAAEKLPHFLPPMFDRVLADVPCTGLGNADALGENRWRYENAKNPSSQYQLQYCILMTACRLVRVGGRIVYSTCSLNPDENESVVHEIISRYPFRILPMRDIAGVHFRPGLTEWDGRSFDPSIALTRRVTPWENDTQGFYVAVLEKTDELDRHHIHEDPHAPRVETRPADDPEIAAILANIERYYGIDPVHFAQYRFLVTARAVYCIDAHWESIIDGFQRAGICLAKKRGGIWRLSHSLIQRMSDHITRNIVRLDDAKMAEICATGEVDVPASEIESPYPVIWYEPMGCLATTYDLGNGRIRWKRPCCQYRL